MKSPILSKFACCCELRTGGFLIGTIDCLLYGALLVIFSLQIFFDIGFVDGHNHKYFGIFPLIFLYISFIISIVFLVGVKQKSSTKVYPYLILLGSQTFVFIFIECFMLSLFLSLLAILKLYCFICVHSLHRKFKCEERSRVESQDSRIAESENKVEVP